MHVVLLTALLLCWSGCGPSVSEETRTLLNNRTEELDGPHAEGILKFYEQRDFRPVWTGSRRPTELAEDLREAVCNCEEHGLSAGSYELASLEQELHQFYEDPPADDSLQRSHRVDLEVQLTRLFFRYADDLLNGRADREALGEHWHLSQRAYPIAPVLGEVTRKQDVDVLEHYVSRHEGYKRLRTAYNRYRQIKNSGGWPLVPPGDPLTPESTGPRVAALQKRLDQSGDLSETAAIDSSFGAATTEALKRFQRRHGLEATGTANQRTLEALNVSAEQRTHQLAVNLERMRWLPMNLGKNRITVNIPDAHLTVQENNQPVMEMPVIVGEQLNQTPVFADTLRYVVFRPYWTVPASIAADEILPELEEDPEEYLSENNYELVTREGNPLPEDSLEEADQERLRDRLDQYEWLIRQKPGPENPLGRIKLMFPNAHNIYLHDTPAHHLFEREQRTFSHGCIRIQRPVELASYVLGDPWTQERIENIIGKEGEPRSVEVARPLPVYILYLTAWYDDRAGINFREDIYDHDSSLQQAIGAEQTDNGRKPCSSLPDD